MQQARQQAAPVSAVKIEQLNTSTVTSCYHQMQQDDSIIRRDKMVQSMAQSQEHPAQHSKRLWRLAGGCAESAASALFERAVAQKQRPRQHSQKLPCKDRNICTFQKARRVEAGTSARLAEAAVQSLQLMHSSKGRNAKTASDRVCRAHQFLRRPCLPRGSSTVNKASAHCTSCKTGSPGFWRLSKDTRRAHTKRYVHSAPAPGCWSQPDNNSVTPQPFPGILWWLNSRAVHKPDGLMGNMMMLSQMKLCLHRASHDIPCMPWLAQHTSWRLNE